MEYIINCLAKFSQLPSSVKQKMGGMDSFLVVQKIQEKYGVDVSFALILVAIGDLSAEDFGLYIKKKNFLALDDAEDISNEVTRKIFSKFLYEKKEIIDKSALASEFKDNLINIFKDKDAAIAFNIKAFKVLAKDGSFLGDLEKALLACEFEIGDKPIIKENRPIKPSVSNWIKDFLIFNSTDNFDNIILARYISSSDNVKNLSDSDKTLIFRLLKTYHNIVFFLENSEKIPIDFLELIAIDMSVSEDEDSLKKDISKENNTVLVEKEELSDVAAVNVDSDLAYLHEELSKYDRDTLEYRVVKQELERLRKNKTS